MRILSGATAAMRRVAARPAPTLSPEGKRRLSYIDWHRAHGENVSLTCRHFAISRPTFYRWLRRYDPRNLMSLEDRSSRPRTLRPRTWTTTEIVAVQRIREQYPAWGKEKLQRLLLRAGTVLSASRVGRILRYLKESGKLVEPLGRISGRRRRWRRPYATRKPRDYQAVAPGDLVQIDTLDVRFADKVLKHFSAVDVVSRWGVPTIASSATARMARTALDALLARMPCTVRAIQIDGGSEFMAEFEEACKARGILLFELPPRSPKLNGCVERLNRTAREEFYEHCTEDFTVAAMRRAARRWEHCYNYVRPHQALAYLTPAQFIANWRTTHPEEVLSRTS